MTQFTWKGVAFYTVVSIFAVIYSMISGLSIEAVMICLILADCCDRRVNNR